jgi:hypothetical protein
MMTDADIDVELHPKGFKAVVNPDAIEDTALPNSVLNAFSDFFNNINSVREDIARGGHRIQVLNKLVLRKLSRL